MAAVLYDVRRSFATDAAPRLILSSNFLILIRSWLSSSCEMLLMAVFSSPSENPARRQGVPLSFLLPYCTHDPSSRLRRYDCFPSGTRFQYRKPPESIESPSCPRPLKAYESNALVLSFMLSPFQFCGLFPSFGFVLSSGYCSIHTRHLCSEAYLRTKAIP